MTCVYVFRPDLILCYYNITRFSSLLGHVDESVFLQPKSNIFRTLQTFCQYLFMFKSRYFNKPSEGIRGPLATAGATAGLGSQHCLNKRGSYETCSIAGTLFLPLRIAINIYLLLLLLRPLLLLQCDATNEYDIVVYNCRTVIIIVGVISRSSN